MTTVLLYTVSALILASSILGILMRMHWNDE